MNILEQLAKNPEFDLSKASPTEIADQLQKMQKMQEALLGEATKRNNEFLEGVKAALSKIQPVQKPVTISVIWDENGNVSVSRSEVRGRSSRKQSTSKANLIDVDKEFPVGAAFQREYNGKTYVIRRPKETEFTVDGVAEPFQTLTTAAKEFAKDEHGNPQSISGVQFWIQRGKRIQ